MFCVSILYVFYLFFESVYTISEICYANVNISIDKPTIIRGTKKNLLSGLLMALKIWFRFLTEKKSSFRNDLGKTTLFHISALKFKRRKKEELVILERYYTRVVNHLEVT